MSPVRTTSEGNLKTQATITGHFGFVYEEILAGKSNDQRDVIVSLRFQCKIGVVKFLRFEERF